MEESGRLDSCSILEVLPHGCPGKQDVTSPDTLQDDLKVLAMEGFMICFQDALELPLRQVLGSWRPDAVPLGLQLVAVAHDMLPRPSRPRSSHWFLH